MFYVNSVFDAKQLNNLKNVIKMLKRIKTNFLIRN